MKKIFSPVLNNFINNFNLARNGSVTSFDADVTFNSHRLNVKFTPQVHIISVQAQERDVIYLLGDDVTRHDLPEMFLIDETIACYLDNECLVLEGTVFNQGKYQLKITPREVFSPVNAN